MLFYACDSTSILVSAHAHGSTVFTFPALHLMVQHEALSVCSVAHWLLEKLNVTLSVTLCVELERWQHHESNARGLDDA